MQIIAPTYIDDARFISSDIPAEEDNAPEWDASTYYVTGQRVVVNQGGYHNIYERMWHTPQNLYYPPDYLTGTPVWWMKVSATNRWKLFDMIVAPDRAKASNNSPGCDWDAGVSWEAGTSWNSTTESSMQVTVLPGEIDTVAIMNVDCTSISLIMQDGGVDVYNETKIPTTTEAANAIYSGLPSYPNATLEVIIRNTGGDVLAGELIIGKSKEIGKARPRVGVGIVDYSAKSVDAFGNFSITERAFSKRLDCNFMMPVATHAGILRLLEKYRSVPLVWIISDTYSTTIVYGFYRDLKVSVPNTVMAEGSLSIEGLGADYIHATPIPDPWVDPWDGIIKLSVLALPALTVTTSKIEEAPASNSISLSVPAVPSAPTVSLSLYELVGECTISNASPVVVTCAGNGLPEGHEIFFQTTGEVPLPLVAGTHYFVKNAGDPTFNLSLTAGGSTIDTTSAGSGTHKVLKKV